MALLKTQYRIDHKVAGCWMSIRSFDDRYSYEVIESHYDKLRNDNPDVELRLVEIEYRVCREGKGQVYE